MAAQNDKPKGKHGGARRGAGRKRLSKEEKQRRAEERKQHRVDDALLAIARQTYAQATPSFAECLAQCAPVDDSPSPSEVEHEQLAAPTALISSAPVVDDLARQGVTISYRQGRGADAETSAKVAREVPDRSPIQQNNSSLPPVFDCQLENQWPASAYTPRQSYLEEMILQDIDRWRWENLK